MKVLIASEGAGYALKEAVKEHLIRAGHEIVDVGMTEGNPVSYPAAGAAIARALQQGVAKKAIAICGSGAGVCVTANKFKGVYAVTCESVATAKGIPVINDANVLAMGGNVVSPADACAMADAYLAAGFVQDFPAERAAYVENLLNDLKAIEEENFK